MAIMETELSGFVRQYISTAMPYSNAAWKLRGKTSVQMVRTVILSLLVFATSVVTSAGSFASTFLSVGKYQSFDQLQTWANVFEAENSDIVDVVEFGRSSQDRPLLAIKLSLTPGFNDPVKPEFLFTAGLHAREVIGSQAAYKLAEHLVAGFRSGDPVFNDIFSEREVWIIPNLNPDGRISVENGNSAQRKNMQIFQGQYPASYGVDINRNFPHKWDFNSSSSNSETYAGPSKLSTPEAAALWGLLKKPQFISSLTAAIDFHSGIGSILTPWTSSALNKNLNPLPPQQRQKFDSLASEMSALTGYAIDALTYNANGTLSDSIYEEFGAYSLCEEVFEGPWIYPDYFTQFNPTNQNEIDSTVAKAIASSMFLLSDRAFAVPEPTMTALLALGGVFAVMFWSRRGQKKR